MPRGPELQNHSDRLLDCRTSEVEIDTCAITEMHVSLPETEQFLAADLSRDSVEDLLTAERPTK